MRVNLHAVILEIILVIDSDLFSDYVIYLPGENLFWTLHAHYITKINYIIHPEDNGFPTMLLQTKQVNIYSLEVLIFILMLSESV